VREIMKILLCAFIPSLKLIKYTSKRWDVDVLTINPAREYGRYGAD